MSNVNRCPLTTPVIMRVRHSIPIEVRQCISYSIGESEDGQWPLVWASGKAGWYELNPAPGYRPIHDKMLEAASLYYALMDIYQSKGPKKPKKSKSNTTIEELSLVFLQVCGPVPSLGS